MYRYTQTLIKKYWNRYVHFRSADPSSSGHFQCQKDINYGPSKQLLSSGTKKLLSLVPVVAQHMTDGLDQCWISRYSALQLRRTNGKI